MTHVHALRPLHRRMVLAVLMCALALAWSGPGWGDIPPVGLPEAPEMPDLYDPEIISTYNLSAKRTYEVNGHSLAPWLIATVLTPKAVHVGPPQIIAAPDAHGGHQKDVIVLIGYVTDTRDGRIIALTETFGHPDDETRSIKAWVDQGWIAKGKGSGEWGPPLRSETALTRRETAAFMESVYRLIQNGFEQTLKK